MERNAISTRLAQMPRQQEESGELLGIQRPTLYNKMRRYEIQL